MKIMYVCGTYYPSTGGAEISAHTLLKELSKKHEVAVVTNEKYVNSDNNISYFGSSQEKRSGIIANSIEIFKPDVIYTQLMWGEKALLYGKKLNIPTVFRVSKMPFELDLRKEGIYNPTKIISVSEAVKNYISETFKRDSEVIKPSVDIDALVKNYREGKNDKIIMFNPLKRKGGEIVKSLASSFKNEKFGLVQGWDCLKTNGEFDPELIKIITESTGEKYDGGVPEYVDMSDLPNVEYIPPTMDVWKIYEQAKIVLVPSQWNEAFGRVALESLALKIPTIVSNTGGLKEASEDGGIIVEEYKSKDAWKKALQKTLDDMVIIKKNLNGTKYSLEDNVKKHLELFESVG